jgi:hypothetical protein
MQKEPRSRRPDVDDDVSIGAPGQPAVVVDVGLPPRNGDAREDTEAVGRDKTNTVDLVLEEEGDLRVYEDVDYGENDDDDRSRRTEKTAQFIHIDEYFDI